MIYVLLGLTSISSVLVVGIYIICHSKIKELAKKLEAHEILMKTFQNEKQSLMHADLRFNEQLAEINEQILSLDKQVQSNSNIRENDGGYQHALKILAMGGNKEEIIQSCHISNAEAELLMNLNAYRSAMAK